MALRGNIQTQAWIVSGRVQGVGFRYFVKSEAKRLGIKGYVTNLHDGTVKVKVQTGEDHSDRIAELSRLCQEGPPGSRVDGLEVIEKNDILSETFQDFEIRD